MKQRPAARPRLLVEELERRILYSADAAALLGLSGAVQGAEVRVVEPAAPTSDSAEAAATARQLAAASAEAQGAREIIFIDSRVPDAMTLADELMQQRGGERRFDIVLLDAHEDGIEQINRILADEHDLAAIHIISHGRDGAIQIGSTDLDAARLAVDAESVARWGQALGADGDLLLYGCDVAQDAAGQAFVQSLARLTGADVAASSDATGHESLGGDWDLEVASGNIDTGIAFSATFRAQWIALLPIANLQATGDTNLQLGAPDANFGASTSLVVDRESTDLQRALFQFDLGSIPVGSTINSATLTLQATQFGGAMSVNVYELTQAWTEGTGDGTAGVASWNQRQAGTNWTTAGGTFNSTAVATLSPGGTGQHTWSITALVQAWVNGSKTNNGVMVASPDAGGNRTITYDSSEGTTVPLLVVDYTPTVGTPSISGLAGDSLRYTAGGGPIVIEQGGNATVTDSDSPNFDTGTLTVSFAAGSNAAEDVLAIRNQGTGAGQIGVSGANVTYGGTTIGSVAGGSAGTPLVVTLNANANPTNTAALVQNITFQDTNTSAPTLGTRTVRFVLNDGDGKTSANVDTSVTLGATSPSAALWVSSSTNATSSAGSGSLSWTDGQVVKFGDPNLALGSGTTAGTFSSVFNIDSFASSDANITGLHQVSRSVVVGTGGGSFTLQAGDVLLAVDNNETLGGVAVTKNDIVLFRPTAPGDYSAGTFSILLQNPTTNAVADFALVEQSTVVGGTTLQAGNFLIAEPGRTDVYRFVPTATGAGSTAGTLTAKFITGANINIGQGIAGLELVQTPLTLGGVSLSAGQLLVALNGNDSTVGGNNLAVLRYDVFTLTLTGTGDGTTAGTAAKLFTGADVGMSAGGEEFDALALVGVNQAPVLSGASNLGTITEDPSSNPGTLVSALISSQVTDGDTGAMTGIAVTAVDNTNGSWQWSANGGATWNAFGSPGTATARLLIADGQTYVRFVPNANWNGTVSNGITFRAWDQTTGTAGLTANTTANGGSTAFSAASASSSITVSAVNDAPTLDASKSPALGAVLEDAGVPTGAQGTLVSALVDFASPTGQVDNVTDPDSGAVTGIAVTAVDTTQGQWFYTINGTNWNNLGAVTDANARLLATDAFTRLYFLPNANYNGTLANAITFRAWDQTSGSNGALANASVNGGATAFSATADTASLVVTPVNDAPSATNLNAAETYTEDTALNLTDIVISDVDSASVTATLTLSNTAAGSLNTGTSGAVTSTYNAGTGVWTASGAIANVNILLAGLTFTPAANFNSAFSIATSVSDGVAAPVTGSKAVTGTAVNDAPSATNLNAAETYTEDTALNLTDIVISDIDSASVTATLTLSNSAAGSLNTGTSGAVTSTYNAGTGVWTASGAIADVNVLLAGLTFTPAANSNSAFTIATSVSDGVAAPVTGSKAMTGTAVNDAPSASNLSAAETYTEDTALNLTDIVISDVDSANVTATLTLSNTAAGSLNTGTSGLVTSTYNAGTGVWTASGAIADVNVLLAGLTFTPAANFNSAFTIATSVSDGVAAPVTGSKAVTGTAVNDAPTATNLSAAETYTEDTALNLTDIVISDVDSANVTATLTLSNTAAGSLNTGTSGLVTSTYNAGTGVWTASGAIADVNTLLAALTFTPAANFNSAFSIATSVSDGVAAPVTGSKAVTGTAVNDAPTATNLSAAETYTEDTALNLTDIVISDVDSANVTATLTLSNTAAGSLNTGTSGAVTSTYNAGTGVWTASGALANVNALLAGLTFTPAANFNSNFTIATSVSDGVAAPLTGSKAVTGTTVNDAPTATNLSAAETYTEDTALNLTDIVISDVDSASVTATLTLSNTAAGSLNTGTSGAVTSTYNAGTGVWTASGALANVNALLAGLTFTPAANFNSNFTIATSVSDGVAAPLTGSKAVTGTTVNDAPTASNLSAAEAYTEDTALNLTDIVISDVDSASVTATLTLSNVAAGSLNTGTSGAVTSTYNAGTGVWTAIGALADVNTLLAALTFTPATNFNSAFTIATNVSDGVAAPVTGTKSFTGTAVNDAPSATNLSAAETYTEDTVLNLTDIVVSDVDSASVTATLTLSNVAAGSLNTGTSGAVTSTYNAGTGVWTASGAIADVNVLLAALTFTPTANLNSNFTIATNVSDGSLSVSGTKSMTGTAVNDAPVNTAPSGQYTPFNTALVFSAANGNQIGIADPDAAASPVQVTLTVGNGTLTLAGTSGLTITGGANGSATMTFTGSAASINTALDGLSYSATTNFRGLDTLQIATSDLGNTGSGGTLTDTDSVKVYAGALVVTNTSDTSNGTTTSIGSLVANDGGDGISLREAIVAANNTAGADRIHFKIAGTGVHTIAPTSALPTITGQVTIDASTDDSFAANGNRPAIILEGTNAGAGTDGLVLTSTADGSVIRGLVIRDFGNDGILIQAGSDNNVIAGNYIGRLTASGTDSGAGTGNDGLGIDVRGSNNTIGGTVATDRNVISGNASTGIGLEDASASGNTVAGNYIGLTAAGTAVLGNGSDGVLIRNGASGNTIGGATAAHRNVIAGNGDGVQISASIGSSDNNVVIGNYIGTDVTGTVDLGNTDDGVDIDDASLNNQILNNLIAGNSSDGIDLAGAGTPTGTIIQGNLIGMAADGSSALGNSGHGIRIGTSGTAYSTTIGGTTGAQGNTIAFNAKDGIFVDVTSTSVAILGNSIYGNTDLGINLGAGGVTANDTGDGDTGANNLQNFPVLASANSNAAGTTIVGTINSNAGTSLRIEFFANRPSIADAPNGEGERYLGFIVVTTDVSGNASVNTVLSNVWVNSGDRISATATNQTTNDTSEFSANVAATSTGIIVVDTTSDVSDGTTTSIFNLGNARGADGRISLREAIIAANATANGGTPDKIVFNIPRTDANHLYYRDNAVTGTFAAAVATTRADSAITDFDADYAAGTARSWYRITLGTTSLDVTQAVIIDGSTQAGYDPAKGPVIEINAAAVTGGDANAIALTTGGSTIRGLVINRAGDNAIEIDVGAASSVIVGNYLGTDVSGTQALGNSTVGTWGAIAVKTNGVVIGGTTAADRNLISGNLGYGIEFYSSASNAVVQGNYIGTTVTGSGSLGNSASGIYLRDSAASNTIGGIGANEGNLIASNGADGIWADAAAGTGNRILGNSIHSNTGQGVDLAANGVTANDVGDADTGANNLQNFPVLTVAATTGAQVTFTGTLNSTASTQFRIEFFASTAQDGSGYGEGQRYLGFANVTTDSSGNATISATLTATVAAGEFISATATKSNAGFTVFTDTSEFAQNVAATAGTAAPVVTATGSTLAYTENAAATAVDSGLTVSDADSTNLTGATVAISANYANGQDVLAFTNQLGITGSWNAATGVMTLTGTTSVANYQTALRAVTYVNTSDNPGTLTRTVAFVVNDGTASSTAATRDISVTAVNDAPSAAITPATYAATEQVALTLHGTGLSIADVDAGGAAVRATVSVTSGILTAAAGLTGVTVTGSGTASVTLDGTLTWINNLLAGNLSGTLGYTANSDTPAASATLTLTASDLGNTGSGGTLTGSDTATINITAVNDAPIITIASLTLNEGQTVTLSGANFGITDPDDASFTYTASGISGGYFQLSSAAGTPITTFTSADLAGNLVQFVDDGNEVAPAFNVKVNDGDVDSNTLAATVTYNPVNDAPVVTSATLTINEGQTVTLTGANFGITDPDDASFTYTVSGVAGGYFQLSSAAGTPITTFTTADLAGNLVQFVDDGNEVTPAFSVKVNDGDVDSNTLAATVTYNPVNDAPVVTSATLTINEGQTVTLTGANFGITDPDDASFTYTVSGISGGYFQLSSAAGTPITTFTTADLAGNLVQFVDDGNEVAPAFSVKVNDGDVDSNTLAATITYAPVNDAPVLAAIEGAALAYTESAAATVISGTVTLSDVDSATVAFAWVRITGNYVNGEDVLSFTSTASITGSWDASAGTLLLIGSDTVANYEAALRAVRYSNSSDSPSTAVRTVSFTANDGAVNSNTVTRDITVTTINDAPTATITPASYGATEQVALTLHGTGLSITDVDAGGAAVRATVSVTSGILTAAAGTTGVTVTGSGTASVTLDGTLTQINNLLAGSLSGTLGYTANSDTPAASATLTLTASDLGNTGSGGTLTGSDTATINITAVNDAPVTTPVTLVAIAEDSGPRLITQAQLLANATDVDGPSLTATGLAISSGLGSLVDNGDGTWTYTPVLNDDTAVSFTYTVTDGTTPVGGSASLDITPVNDAPATTPVTLTAIAEDSGPRLITQAELLANATDVDGPSLTATGLAISSGLGSLVDNGDGTWTYTSALNDDTAVSFSYTVTDGTTPVAGSASLDITPVNDAPVTSLVTLTAIAEDSGPRLITQAQLLANATDIDGPSLTATGLAISSGAGSLVDNGDGTWTYTPALNDDSSVSFSYAVIDGSLTAGGTASLDITQVNDAPVTSLVTLTAIAEDSGPRLITQAQLLANATDIDGPSLTATGLAISSGLGSLVDNGDGTWTYTPALNDDSSVSFSYTVTDGTTPVAGSASLDITPVNDAPVTTSVTLTAIAEDSGPRLITQAQLLANATDIDGPSLTATGLAISSGAGSLVDNGDGTWTYTPALNDETSVSFSYTVTDGSLTAAGTASLDITPFNNPPVTSPVTLTAIAEDSGPRLITQAQLLANATDVDGPGLTATGLAISSGLGSLVDNGDGTWTYTSALNDDTAVSFSYTVTDGSLTAAGSANLDITPVNDAPVTSLVTLTAIAEDSGPRLITQAQLLANATDIDGPSLTATGLAISSGAGSLVDNGDGTWTYTPALNDDTAVSFSYTVTDGSLTAAGSANLDITPVNDAPVTSLVTLTAIAEDSGPRLITQAQLLANATDIDGPSLTATGLAISSGAGSLVDNGDGTWTYTPALNDDTAVSFSYTVTDGSLTAAGSANLDITPVNDAPVTSLVTLTAIAEDSGPRLITQAELLANATDIDGPSLTATGLAISSGAGSLVDNGDGTWAYTPALSEDSAVSFTYTVTDGTTPVAGSASLDITPVNDAPETSLVTFTAIAEDSGPRVITQAELLANATDVDGPSLTATGLAIASGSGTLVDNGDGTWTYTPALNDDSSVSFTYTVTDGTTPVAGTANLDITPVNDAPVTSLVTLTAIAEDSGPQLITQAQLVANATDIDSPSLTATGLAISSGLGSLVDNGDGTWTYTPALNDDSSVSFSYTVTDGSLNTAGSATLDITPVNDAPVTTPVTLAAIAEDSGPRLITQAELLANATDVDGPSLTATGLAISSGAGTLVNNGDGTWTYTPALNDETSVSFSYTVTDGTTPVAGTASLDITPVNDAPVTTPVTLVAIAEDSGPRLITQAQLLANATDIDGPSLTATGLAISSGLGSLVDNGDGTWTYTPALNDETSVSFSYTVTDGTTPVAGSANLDITPVNDAPVTSLVTLTAIAEDSGPRLITQAQLLANATDVDGPSLTATGLAISSGLGSLVDNGDGTWTYTPALNDDTAVSFTYTVTDGTTPVAGSASLDITLVNDAPSATNLSAAETYTEDTPLDLTDIVISDVDSASVTATLTLSNVGAGSLNTGTSGLVTSTFVAGVWTASGALADVNALLAALTFTPTADFNSSFTIATSASDGVAAPVTGSKAMTGSAVNDAPTGSVTIDDTTPTQGQALTASNTLADLDGLGTISYQWQRGGVNIAGATGVTYTTTQSDVGSVLRVVASYTDAQGTAESVASANTVAVTNVNDLPTGSVAIDDTTPTQGQTLTASNTLADLDGLGTITYQWQRGGVDIAGATSSTYTTTQSDVGSVLRVIASYTDGQGTAESVASANTVAVANVNDAPTGSVAIDDTTPTQGETLTASNTLADADGLGAISYQWQRGGVNIAGATGASYTTTQSDVGSVLRVIASYTDGQGTAESVASADTSAVTNINDAPTGSVTIDDTTPTQGQTLTVSNTLADPDGVGTITYQWQRGGVDIAGATGAAYTTTQSDVGSVLRVIASYTDGQGTPESVASANTAAVANLNDLPIGSVTIDDTTPTQGQTLTASNTLADLDGLGAISYQWQRGGVDIAGATGSTYTTTQSDVGSVLRVVASYTDGQGTPESVASANTAAVANVNDAPTGSVAIDDTTPTQGQTLTASNTLADLDGLGTISYQWQRGGVSIAGATSSTYTTTQSDVGSVLRVIASYTDTLGTAEAVASADTATVANINDLPTGSVAINGTPTRGQTLTASNTLADADGQGSISYQWRADGSDISGASAQTYILSMAELGKVITVVASYTDGQGTAEAVTSGSTAAVANVNDVPTVGYAPPLAPESPGSQNPAPVIFGNSAAPAGQVSATESSNVAGDVPGGQADRSTASLDPASALGLGSPAYAPRGEATPLIRLSQESATRTPWAPPAKSPFDLDLLGAAEPYLMRIDFTPVTESQPDANNEWRINRSDAAAQGPAARSADEGASSPEVVQATQAAGVALTVGTVLWALRAGGLLASLLGSLPAWRHVDLLAILPDEEDDREDGNLETDDQGRRDENAVKDLLEPTRAGDES